MCEAVLPQVRAGGGSVLQAARQEWVARLLNAGISRRAVCPDAVDMFLSRLETHSLLRMLSLEVTAQQDRCRVGACTLHSEPQCSVWHALCAACARKTRLQNVQWLSSAHHNRWEDSGNPPAAMCMLGRFASVWIHDS